MPQLTATFYQFVKRRNSTMRPSSTGTQLNITINDGASTLLNPSIRVQYVAAEPYQYNYCYINMFARYYFITDWAFNGDGTWTAACEVDVLATYKPTIQTSGGYVNRAYMLNGAEAKNSDLYDTVYPAENWMVYYRTAFQTSPLHYNFSDGTFIIGCVGVPKNDQGEATANPTAGSTTYYAVAPAEMRRFVANMTAQSQTDWSEIGVPSTDVPVIGDVIVGMLNMQKTQANPFQYLVSCKWFPYNVTTVSQTPEIITLGGWATGAYGRRLTATWQYVPNNTGSTPTFINSNQVDEIGVDIYPTYDLNRFPHIEPYATYSLFTPWGVFDLDADYMAVFMKQPKSQRILQYTLEAEMISGSGVFKLYCMGRPIMKRAVQLALDIPLTQITRDTLQEASNYASFVSGAAFGIPSGVAQAVGSMGRDTSGVNGAIRNTLSDAHAVATFRPSVLSTASTSAAFTPDISMVELYITRYRTVEQMPHLIGRPYKKPVAALTGFSGFVQMSESDFVGSSICTDTERNDVVQYLVGGVFIE